MQTRLSRIFNHMKLRCYNANHHNYKNYGARGIKLCDEWNNRELAHEEGRTTKGFLVFKKWALENGYADNLTLVRKIFDKLLTSLTLLLHFLTFRQRFVLGWS